MDDPIEQVVTQPEAAPVEAPAPAKPAIDEANIRKQAAYFAKHPEAADVFLENYDNLSGGKLSAKVTQLEQAFYMSEAMRKYGLGDDMADLIKDTTPEGIYAKAAKLAAIKASASEAQGNATKPEPEIIFNMPEPTYANPMEAAYARLARFKG
jgi:hypothetical protein